MATSVPYDIWLEWLPFNELLADPSDVSYVRSTLKILSLDFGRGTERAVGKVEKAEVNIELLDPNRQMDPFNRQGPYWSSLQAPRQFRIRAQGNSAGSPVVTILRGYWKGIPVPSWTMGRIVTKITGVDTLGLLDKVIKGTVYDRIVAAAAPKYWLSMEEGAANFSLPKAGPAYASNTLVSQGGNLMPYGDQASVSYPNTGSRTDLFLPAGMSTGANFAVAIVAQAGPGTGVQIAFALGSYDPATVLYGDACLVFNDPAFALPNSTWSVGTPAGRLRITNPGAKNNVPTLFVCQSSATLGMQIDQIPMVGPAIGTSTGSIPNTPRAGFIRLGNTLDSATLNVPLTGSLCNFAFWDRSLTGTELSNLILSYRLPLDGQRSDQQAAWVLDELGIVSSRRNLETGTSLQGPLRLNRTALAILSDIAATEGGRLFAARDGKITLYAANHTPTTGVVYDTNPPTGSTNRGCKDVEPAADERTFWNEAHTYVASPTPTEVVYTHPAADNRGVNPYDQDTHFRTEDLARRRGWAIVGDGQPKLSIVNATIRGGAKNVDWEELLVEDVGTEHRVIARIRATDDDKPSGTYIEWGDPGFWGGTKGWGGPGPIDRNQRVFYVQHTLDGAGQEWTTKLDMEGT